VVGALLLLSPLVRGFALLDLWARILGIPETAFRALAGALLVMIAGSVHILHRRRPETNETLALLVIVTPAVATLLGCLGRFSWWMELYSHFRWQYAAGLFAGALYFLCHRRKRLALATAGLASVNLYIASPQLLVWPGVEAGDGRTIRLAMANLHKRNRDVESVLRFVEREDPDVLVVVEFTPEWNGRLLPLTASYRHSFLLPRDDSFGIGLFSKHPVLSREVLEYAGEIYPSIAARVEVSGRPLLIVGAHPPAPRDPRVYRYRNRIYAGLAGLARTTRDPLVILGDLNSTPWGSSFRRLIEDGGLGDSSEGRGLQWSWPAGFWPFAIPIDHCLVSRDLRITNRYMGPDIGSDHYPLVVDLALSD
jgi:endonuclease/exonuclease/phosphatase (EEP) superfamily protein YafD